VSSTPTGQLDAKNLAKFDLTNREKKLLKFKIISVILNVKFYIVLNTTKQLLIVLMSALGIGLTLSPATGGINSGLFKGSAWLFSGIVSRLFK
jgi:hypothetical protein